LSDHLFEKLGPENNGSVAAGFVIGFGPGLLINLFSGCASLDRFNQNPAALLVAMIVGIALGQVLFTLPSYFHFKNQGSPNTCRGLLIGASVACLIGVTCGVGLTR
jgi:hypothetical protein